MEETVLRCETTDTPLDQMRLSGLNKNRSKAQRQVSFAQWKLGKKPVAGPTGDSNEGNKKVTSIESIQTKATLGKSGKALLATKCRYGEELESRIEFCKQRTRLTKAQVLL